MTRPRPSFTPASAPLVSVIVLNRNGASLLERCIGQLYSQTYPRLEVVVLDNNSTDSSCAILERYCSRPNFGLLRCERNLGVAGGRNFALKRTRGEIIAFIDNDGYADERWLENSVAELISAPDIGAVGALVTFNRNKLVVNGTGGSWNRQWYAADLNYNVPLEFAAIPDEALYPMGCGMVLRRDALLQIGELDEASQKWFDDTELGARLQLCGYRVRIAADAWVDHDFHTSNAANGTPEWRQAFQYECARLRMGVKYQERSGLSGWLSAELKLIRYFLARNWRHAVVLCLAWLWNVVRLRSALAIRKRFVGRRRIPAALVQPGFGQFPPPMPLNQDLVVGEPAPIPSVLAASAAVQSQLHFGWYPAAEWRGVMSILGAQQAAILVKLTRPATRLTVRAAAGAESYAGRIVLREFGSLNAAAEHSITFASQFSTEQLPLEIGAEWYELLFLTDAPSRLADGRVVGIALAELAFE